MGHADAMFAPDGYQYGVRFTDGSVMHRWNGRTQREHVEREAARWMAQAREHGNTWDQIDPVRRLPGEKWHTYEEQPMSRNRTRTTRPLVTGNEPVDPTTKPDPIYAMTCNDAKAPYGYPGHTEPRYYLQEGWPPPMEEAPAWTPWAERHRVEQEAI